MFTIGSAASERWKDLGFAGDGGGSPQLGGVPGVCIRVHWRCVQKGKLGWDWASQAS